MQLVNYFEHTRFKFDVGFRIYIKVNSQKHECVCACVCAR